MSVKSEVYWLVQIRSQGAEQWNDVSEHRNGVSAVLAMNQEKAYHAERTPVPVQVRAVKVQRLVTVIAEVQS